MSGLVSRTNLLRFLLVLLVAAFMVAIYTASPSRLGGRVPVVMAEVGGVVDVQINDASGTFVFTPAQCHTQIASLSQCATSLLVSNVGGSNSVHFEYSVEIWADADGVDSGDPGSAGDTLSSCFTVSLSQGILAAPAPTASRVGPIFGYLIHLNESHDWRARVAVKPDNACQGATTTVIIAVTASDIPSFFDGIRTPTVAPSPSPSAAPPTATPEPEATLAPSTGGGDEVAQVPEQQPETPTPQVTPTTSPTPRPGTPTAVPATPTIVPAAIATPAPTEEPTPEPVVESLPGRADGPNFLVQRIPGPSSVSTDVKVIATNITLSLIALTIILVATTMFNATLEENAVELSLLMNRLSGGAQGIGRTLGWVDQADVNEHPGMLGTLLKPMIIVGITALIYAALEPSFGFNDSTLILIVALMAGIATTTFLFEGGQVFWSSKRYQTPASMRVYPLAIVIAIASVLLTRFADLHPGIIFGFVTAAAIFPRGGKMNPRDRGMIVLVPLASLIVMSILAFFLIEPFRDYAASHDGVWYALPETIAIALFVGGAQGSLLILIPVTFNDGEKIWAWNKLVWLALALPASFMFFHIMVNSEGDFGDLTESGLGGFTLLIASAVFLGVSFLTWQYFRMRRRRLGDDD